MIYEGYRFPNGKRKSELFDFFLSHHDFLCSEDQYAEDLELIRAEEHVGLKNCTWSRDSDGRLVVSGLELRDSAARVVIVPDAFVMALTPDARPTVFISYAREDLEAAERLTDVLARAGFMPWLDRRRLNGGHRWKPMIEDTIRTSDFFLAVLSASSVTKRGFVQREIRRALDVLEEMPERSVFIVPVRLDECEPAHAALRDLNWIDLFPDWTGGTKRLVRSLNSARHAI